MSSRPPRGVVALLTAQAFAFGITLALLLIPANSLFLDAYGSRWLPVTYIAIAIVGTGASALIARSARRRRLVHVATASLGAIAALFLASWAVLVAGGTWVSAVLLVLFPIALQVGFVFVGGQAGRLLDVRQMKELFPRVVSGFAVGFLVGGLLGIPLLALLGSTEQLLLATTLAQLAFLGLLLVTERRFPEVRAAPAPGAPAVERPPLRTLFVPGLALLLLVYQVLSAMGSQVVDFLLFDRAAARYSGDELTQFLSVYTAALNLVDILFLALIAGPLLRHFGLRLGLLLNPAVVAAALGVMAVAAAGPGVASLAVFAMAGLVRIADIAATDGTTRTSINAAYQVVPAEERLAVQAVVEGIGVPLAIGATGVLILVLDALGLGVGAVIGFGLALGVAWTAVAVVAYRSYARRLADEVRHRTLLGREPGPSLDAELPAIRELLQSDDARDVRLGLDLLAGAASPVSRAELLRLAEHPDPELRMRALGALAAGGDEHARARATSLVDDLACSTEPADRRAAAGGLGWAGATAGGRTALLLLLEDADPSVRAAAFDAVVPADASDPRLVGLVVSAVERCDCGGRSIEALRRLGAAAVPALAAALESATAPDRRAALVRAAAGGQGRGLVIASLADADRTVVLAALDALDPSGRELVEPAVLERALHDAAVLAARVLAVRGALGPEHGALVRALDDELELCRRLVVGVLAVRHGDRVREAVRVVDHAEGARRALGVEALDVVLSREEAAQALPLVRRDLSPSERAAALRHLAPAPRELDEWLADLTGDPDRIWRSSWLATCALHTGERR